MKINLRKAKHNEKEREKGITLVALVVTIVVLLILAGVTIATLFSDNGIIKSAQGAANKTKIGVFKDSVRLEILEAQMGEDGSFKNALAQETIATIIRKYNGEYDKAKKEITFEGTKIPLSEIYSGEIELPTAKKGEMVEESTKVAKYTETNGDIAYIPGGYCIVNDKNNTIQKGLVISDLEGDTMTNDGANKGNQFVWVPVPDSTTMYEIQDGQKVGKLYDFGKYNLSTKKWTAYDKPQVKAYQGENTGNREPDIVKSYDGNDATNSSYFKAVFGENITREQFGEELQNKFDKMIKSVEKYKGFYIGRYETGDIASTTTPPVVQRGNSNLGGINWYWQYKNSQKIAKNNNVTSSMIWGCQWDRTLTWLFENRKKTMAEIVVDSSNWGNYGSKKATGSNNTYKAGNIYDLAGNVKEWTIESIGNGNRVIRGGSCYVTGVAGPSSYREGGLPYETGSINGSRSTLIIEP